MPHPIQDLSTIKNPNQAFAYWLLHCYLYYIADNEIISDADFNKLNRWVMQSWQFITHPHKHLVTMDDLEASSGSAIKYPLRVEMAAWQVLRDIAEPSHKKLVKTVVKPRVTANKTYLEYDSLFGA